MLSNRAANNEVKHHCFSKKGQQIASESINKISSSL
jgi:hypothetical protein